MAPYITSLFSSGDAEKIDMSALSPLQRLKVNFWTPLALRAAKRSMFVRELVVKLAK